MSAGRQSKCGLSSGPTAPKATSTEPLIGISTLRAGMLALLYPTCLLAVSLSWPTFKAIFFANGECLLEVLS